MANKVWKIYRIFGKCGAAYVGITASTVPVRWHSHRRAAKQGLGGLLGSMIREKGAEWFTYETLCECYSVREAIVCERAMIAAYNTYYNQGGLNRNIGGGGNVAGDHLSPERSARLSENMKARMADPAQRSMGARAYNAMGRPVSEQGRKRKLEGLRAAHTPEVAARSAATKRARWSKPELLAEKRHREWALIEYEKALAYRVGRVRPHRFHPSYASADWFRSGNHPGNRTK